MSKLKVNELIVSNFTYYLYLYFIISFFIRLPARIKPMGIIRQDMLLAVIILLSLVAQSKKLKGKLNNDVAKRLNIFFIYVVLSIPLVEWPGSVLNNFTVFIKALMFFYFTALIIDNEKRLRTFIFVVILCQIFRIIEPLYLNLFYGYTSSKTYIGSGQFTDRLAGGPYDVINPNGLAFVICIAFALIHYVWGTEKLKNKLVYFSLLPAFLYTMILTLSRSGMIAMGVGLLSILVKSKNKVLIVIITLVAAFGLWVNMSAIQKDRYLSIIGKTDSAQADTAKSRMAGFSKGFKVILNRPIFGHGVGTSKEALYNNLGQDHVSHIFYLEVTIETGIIGFIIIFTFLVALYKNIKKLNHLAKTLKDNSKEYKDSIIDNLNYLGKLTHSIHSLFWIYLIFSLAQYGVSEYHWYLLAGIVVVTHRQLAIINEKIKIREV